MSKRTTWPIDITLSGATTPDRSRPASDSNEVLRIPESSSITVASRSDCLVSYPGHSFGGLLTQLQKLGWYILQPQQTKFLIIRAD